VNALWRHITRLFGQRSKDLTRQTLWLVKDDPDGKWDCACPQGIVDAPYHDENIGPVGGTGWLFTCIRCKRAFMFARAVRLRQSFRELAQRGTPRTQTVYQIDGSKRTEVLLAGPDDWMARVLPLADGLVEGERYAFFGGKILPARHGPVKFRGLFREHDLPDLPHLASPPTSDVLLDGEYWTTETG
jgi:hypothetical protein